MLRLPLDANSSSASTCSRGYAPSSTPPRIQATFPLNSLNDTSLSCIVPSNASLQTFSTVTTSSNGTAGGAQAGYPGDTPGDRGSDSTGMGMPTIRSDPAWLLAGWLSIVEGSVSGNGIGTGDTSCDWSSIVEGSTGMGIPSGERNHDGLFGVFIMRLLLLAVPGSQNTKFSSLRSS